MRVAASGAVPKELGLDRKILTGLGFEGKAAQVLVLTKEPPVVAVGIGDPATVDAARLRDAAAAFARAVPRHASLSTDLADTPGVTSEPPVRQSLRACFLPATHGRTQVEAVDHAPGQHQPHSRLPDPGSCAQRRRARSDFRRGGNAGTRPRELAARLPHRYAHAEVATRIAKDTTLKVEVFDKAALVRMGCGGLLGVNAGSTEPPRMIKLTYSPNGGRGSKRPAHLSLVGKGIMYDSGGISLKPSDAVHATMKQDMSGAGAILAAMSALKALDCKSAVTGYLMCTDNMPSGSATKLGDVLTIRGGTTVEVTNADAEGRLVMADALVLAAEESPTP